MTAARCGTISGYQTHKASGETPCDPCKRAKSEYGKRWRSSAENTRKTRLYSRAQGRATTRLRQTFPELWTKLYSEALAEVYAESGEQVAE